MSALRVGDPGYAEAVRGIFERFAARVNTPEKAKAWFARLGTHDADGILMPEFGGPQSPPVADQNFSTN
jgi:hypothetical protein